MTIEDVRKAQTIAATLLPNNEAVDERQIRDAVTRASTLVNLTDQELESLIRNLQASYTVSVGIAGTLDDDRNHIEWLADNREQIEWKAWERYRRYLQDVKGFPLPVVNRLDEVTDQILMRFESPRRSGSWDRRGMVVGHVQSGKTANYTGLINKAVDAGYKIVVVLTGMDDALRSQTQVRLDEGVVGYDTRKRMAADQSNSRIGVGLIGGASVVNVNSLTSSEQKGDFKKTIAQSLGVNPGGKDPILLVVKKNKSILNNLISWITSFDARKDESNTRVLYNTPLLVIDDECDFASINTNPNDPDVDPTAINLCVRKLLRSFDQSAYVGYTATPFANIFIAPDSPGDEEFGENLFPRDFIVSLKRSSDYVGATRVFGIDEDPTTGIDELEALPILRAVDDQEDWLESGHKNGFRIGPVLPKSMREAIWSFVLVCAARAQRGQEREHNSMLVHVTRFVSVQRDITQQILDEVSLLRQRIRYGEGDREFTAMDELRALWERDFKTTTNGIEGYEDKYVPWDEILPHIQTAVSKVNVRMVNGLSQEALEYFDQEGISVIAVGGSKLSRGLTLEGLSVSYYLRTSKMYDTLMQMGRWFGYRPGYLDLCRLYTTDELIEWYRETALASEDLLMQFDEMTLTGGTPSDFGLRVRNSSSGLLITRAGAMREKTRMKLTFSGDITETIKFRKNQEKVASNLGSIEELISDLDSHVRPIVKNHKLVWSGISNDAILNFLSNYQTHPDNYKVNKRLIADYIKARNRDQPPELTDWTVAVINGPNNPFKIGNHELGHIVRKDLTPGSTDFTIKRLVSPTDERIDLDEIQTAEALRQTMLMFDRQLLKTKDGNPPTEVSGRAVRAVRSPSKGVLLLYLIQATAEVGSTDTKPFAGFAISFPRSALGEASAVDYSANAVYRESEMGDE
jgi:hypothetical protein